MKPYLILLILALLLSSCAPDNAAAIRQAGANVLETRDNPIPAAKVALDGALDFIATAGITLAVLALAAVFGKFALGTFGVFSVGQVVAAANMRAEQNRRQEQRQGAVTSQQQQQGKRRGWSLAPMLGKLRAWWGNLGKRKGGQKPAQQQGRPQQPQGQRPNGQPQSMTQEQALRYLQHQKSVAEMQGRKFDPNNPGGRPQQGQPQRPQARPMQGNMFGPPVQPPPPDDGENIPF